MTLREHLEAIRDNHAQDGSGTCGWCDSSARCPDFDNAVAALALIDEAHRLHKTGPGSLFRMILDTEASS